MREFYKKSLIEGFRVNVLKSNNRIKGRILHVVNWWLVGGVEFYVKNFCVSFPDYENVVVIKNYSECYEMVEELKELGITVYYNKGRVITDNLIDEIDPDIIIWHGIHEKNEPSKREYPGILWIKVYHEQLNDILDCFSKSVFVSKQAMDRYGSIVKESCYCCPGCIEIDLYKRKQCDEKFVIGRFGSTRVEKFDDRNTQIFTDLAEEGTQFCVISDTLEYYGLGEVVIKPVSVYKKYDYLGGMDVAYYRNSKVKVEGYSISILEMMASGLVVVAEKRGGNIEQIVDGVTGFLVDWEDVEGFISKLKLLREDKLLRKVMSDNAVEWVRNNGGLDRFRKDWLNVIG